MALGKEIRAEADFSVGRNVLVAKDEETETPQPHVQRLGVRPPPVDTLGREFLLREEENEYD